MIYVENKDLVIPEVKHWQMTNTTQEEVPLKRMVKFVLL